MRLSILIPVYNEYATIYASLLRVVGVSLPGLEREIIVVDDGSTDSTLTEIKRFIKDYPLVHIHHFHHTHNQGKGAALHLAISHAKGDFLLVQDADLEYDPTDYPRLISPLLHGHADVVYGSRFVGDLPHRTLFFWHYLGNKFLTFLSNMFSNLNLTDIETCYKVFRADVLKSLHLKEKRFGFEPEVTQKIARISGIRVYEVGISYYGRTYREGKKITWKDGFRTLWCILKYGLFRG